MIRIEGPLTVWDRERVYITKNVLFPHSEELELECNGCLLTRSFVNAHTHLPMVLLRGLVTEKNFWEWLSITRELEEDLKRKELWAGYIIGIYENLINGITRIYSMYRGYELVDETLGVTLHLGPLSTTENDKNVHKLLKRFLKRKPPSVEPTLYAHSLYLTPRERLEEIAEINLPFQIHVSETKEEVLKIKKMYGDYPVRVLQNMGLIRDGTMLVHGGWLTKSELDIMRGCILVHVPAANYRLATHGFFPWLEAHRRGIKVMFGTDSPLSNDGQSIIDDVRIGLLSAKERYWDATPFNRTLLNHIFDDGWALWKPHYPLIIKGEELVTTFLYSPSLFRLRLLYKDGSILYPRRFPVLRRALKVMERYRERVI